MDACCVTPPLLREPLTESAAVGMAKKLKALADPVRLRLFRAIASHSGGEAYVCDVSGGVDVSQPTVSHHLKVLRDAGLLTSEPGVVGVLRRDLEALHDISALLDLNIAALAGVTA